jgi:superfamily II DNA or RNA helicase
VKLDSRITVRTDELTEREWRKLFTRLTFTDAEGYEVSAFQHRSGRGVVEMPRGAWDMLPSHVDVIDMRSRPKMRKVAYRKQLDAPGYEGQSEAVMAMFEREQGQVIAPPGRGKTEIALAFAATCRTRVLVVVHTHDLMKQWIDRAQQSVPGMAVGKIQGNTCQVEHLTIATAQTLKRHLRDGGAFWRQFGAIVIDEAHHAAAETWEWLLNVCPAYYRFGVTASEKRSDGRQALVRFNIGPVIYKLKFESQVPMTVVPVKTGFKTRYNGQQYTRILQELVKDAERNRRTAELAIKEISAGNSVLVLSRQIAHLEAIYAEMNQVAPDGEYNFNEQAEIVTGQIPRGKRDKYISALRDGSLRCILGTQLFEEGVDVPRLNRIILAFPGTEITALQKVGRGSRQSEGKTETIIYDMLDDLVRVLAKQYLRRKTWYQSVGIKVDKVKEARNAQAKEPAKKKGRKLLAQFQVARPARH